MNEAAIEYRFVVEPRHGAMMFRVAVGAAVGLLWYYNDRHILNSAFRQVNYMLETTSK